MSDLSLTQFICFEVHPECNLDATHCDRCPSGDADRYGTLDTSRLLDDETIIDCVAYAYDHGFTGLTCWHYYNEPLLSWERLRPLLLRIRQCVPEARFGLWTNGTLIRTRVRPEELSVFSAVWVSNYTARDWSFLEKHVPRVTVIPDALDGRKLPGDRNATQCYRPYNELVIDAYGNGHLCCADWQGTAKVGNVHTDGYARVVERYLELREQVAQSPMPDGAPAVCFTCRIRTHHVDGLVPEVAARIRKRLGLE